MTCRCTPGMTSPAPPSRTRRTARPPARLHAPAHPPARSRSRGSPSTRPRHSESDRSAPRPSARRSNPPTHSRPDCRPSVDLDGPGRGPHLAGVIGRVILAGAEFVEIVVGADVLKRGGLQRLCARGSPRQRSPRPQTPAPASSARRFSHSAFGVASARVSLFVQRCAMVHSFAVCPNLGRNRGPARSRTRYLTATTFQAAHMFHGRHKRFVN